MQGGRLRLQKFSYRFAEQVLNSKLALKEVIERTLTEEIADFGLLSRPGFNKLLDERFVTKGWTRQPAVFQDAEELGAKMDFLKERIGIEVGFGHASFLGIDLLKFQVSSYSAWGEESATMPPPTGNCHQPRPAVMVRIRMLASMAPSKPR